MKLSFCIPTLNFGPFIGATLNSIIEQADERVQIVIVDGGSTDNTIAVVEEAKTRFPRIKLIQRLNFGLDRDILEAVNQAEGEYCWLLGADDLLAPGAMSRAFAAIDEGAWDVCLMGVKICNQEMKPLHDHPILDSVARTFNWDILSDRNEYFQRGRTTTAFFSYISNVLVRRKRWVCSPSVDGHIGCYWIIAAKLFAMSRSGLKVRYEPAISVLKRLGNDSFQALGSMWRFRLSFKGFRDLASHFFGADSFEAREVSRCVANEYPLAHVLEYKRLIVPDAGKETRNEFYELVWRNYRAKGLRYALVRLAPVWLLTLLRAPYRALGLNR